MLDGLPHSYEHFSKQRFCVAVDQALLAKAPPVESAADLGTGTGTIVEHLYTLGKLDATSRVIAVDCDQESLELARSKLRSRPQVVYVCACAEQTPLRDASVALVTLCNSIHLMRPARVLGEAYRILAPGGLALVNTAYERTQASPDGTARCWGLIVRSARRHPVLAGYQAIPHPLQLKNYSGVEYRAMAEAAGFCDVAIEYHTVSMDRSALKAICDYEGFAQGALPGVPTELATRALIDAIDPVLERSKIDAIPRTWMFMVARKGLAQP